MGRIKFIFESEQFSFSSKISGIPCSAEIDLNGIPTVGNLTEINRASETRKFRGNVT